MSLVTPREVLVHGGGEATLPGGVERIADLDRAGTQYLAALRARGGITKQPARDVEAEPEETIRLCHAGGGDFRIRGIDRRADGEQRGVLVVRQRVRGGELEAALLG